jgi:hypothetical protein
MTRAQCRLGWITVTHVCSLWRQVALNHSTLWTYQRFNLGLEWTAEMLRRAGDAPLNLTFSEEIIPFPPSKDDSATVISKLLHRVSTLTIGEGAFTIAVLKTLTQPAPLMSSLNISSASGKLVTLPRSLFADGAPKLQHLFMCNILPIWTAPALTGLKSLILKINCHTDVVDIPSYTDLFNALRVMPSLESLELAGCLPLGAFPPSLKERKVETLKLRQLALHGHAPGFRQILENLDFPPETIVGGTCLTDDMTGKECCDILPLLLSRLPLPSLETLEVSWGDRFDRNFHISGYSTSQEEEISGKPCFLLQGNRRFSIGFQFKLLLWSAEQKVRILRAVYNALPTEELRALSGTLDLGKEAWPEIFGGHQKLCHIRVCSLSTLHSLTPLLGREGVYPNLVSLTLCGMDISSKQSGTGVLIDRLKISRPPKLRKVFIDSCRIRRHDVDLMKRAAPDLEIQWDEVELPGQNWTVPGVSRRLLNH